MGIEDFEGDSTGSFLGGSRTLAFPPTADSGTLQSLATFSADIMNVSFPGAFGPTSGTNWLFPGTSGNSSFFELTLDTPQTAFGFYGSSFSDYQTAPGGSFPPISLTLDSGTPIDVLNVNPSSIPGGSVNFFGVVSDTPFTTIRLLNPSGTFNDGVGIDDIITAQGIQAVPEPSSWILVTIGLAAVGCLGTKRGQLTGLGDFPQCTYRTSAHAPSPSRGRSRQRRWRLDGRGGDGVTRPLKGDRSVCPIPLPTSPLKGEEFLWQQGLLVGIPGCFFLEIT